MGPSADGLDDMEVVRMVPQFRRTRRRAETVASLRQLWVDLLPEGLTDNEVMEYCERLVIANRNNRQGEQGSGSRNVNDVGSRRP